jgi:hypothetical protein
MYIQRQDGYLEKSEEESRPASGAWPLRRTIYTAGDGDGDGEEDTTTGAAE